MTGRRSSGALEGLRVLDLTQMLAGPFCTMMLADQGADVIKIEPLDGDGTRQMGPFHPDDQLRAFGGYFQSVNRNKASLALNLKRPEGREVFLSLLDGAQVVVENYRAGVMDRLGLAYSTLRERNRRIVYASIRGFGDPQTASSPYVDWPAFDVVAQAMGGIMAITGADGRTPTKIGPGVGDTIPAIMAAFGIMAAVWRAERSGDGQYVDVAMVDSVLSVCERALHQYTYGGKVSGPEGNRHPFLAPFGLLPAKDGFIALACHNDEFWVTLCRLIGRPDLIADARFGSQQERATHQNEVYAEIGAYTAQRTRRELAAVLGGRVPFGPVYDVTDIAADAHFRARDMVVELDHPGLDQRPAVAGVPVRLSDTPGEIWRRAPLLGEHTDEVLRGCGFSAHLIACLRANGVVK
jgi:crotonobetainyl-CoA:carnitine CoA-transferase CaiB-like acyl-CoA transferase